MLCIGFGRWPPQNIIEVWVTMISMLMGASLYAMFIGYISTLIQSETCASRSYNEKVRLPSVSPHYVSHEVSIQLPDSHNYLNCLFLWS